jgi:NAD(P)-dependent dehydrogenase (short-subunit alcohol dehydrogenase family)
MDLDGRSALVTGGAGGLGSAAVRRLVEQGMGVAIFDRDLDR